MLTSRGEIIFIKFYQDFFKAIFLNVLSLHNTKQQLF